MVNNIVFIHGMFQNAKSWEKWITYFTAKGYNCIAPSWKYHEGDPATLRAQPDKGLGDLRLEDIQAQFEEVISQLPEPPIVIGHSVGGLLVQRLANKQLIKLGVPISSVAPNAMLSLDWDFFKNSIKIANPFKGDEPFLMNEEGFHDAFCNTLSEIDAHIAFEETATHDSRNVLRDCMMAPGHVDLDLPHVPLLFVAGKEDHIIPYELVEKNSKAYNDEQSTTLFKAFDNRSHYICGEPGYEEVQQYIFNWIETNQ